MTERAGHHKGVAAAAAEREAACYAVVQHVSGCLLSVAPANAWIVT
jgi:hypothetical protein